MQASTFRDLVSGRRKGVAAWLVRCGLALVECPYRWVVAWRNRAFDTGRKETHRVEVPVISVGNLTLGGTGKTPTVQWIAQWFLDQNVPVAIVSRGYGSRDGAPNDEALELADKLPSVPHVQNPDRVAGAKRAIAKHQCHVIVLDDGFQHRRIARDLDVVLLDATEPFGFDRVFPRGMLREPVANLARADVVALTRADMITPDDKASIRRRVERLAPDAIWLEIVYHPGGLRNASGSHEAIESLAGQRIGAFCGIGNPNGFFKTLASYDCDVVVQKEFPDHAAYGDTDIEQLTHWAETAGVDAMVCTHKDLVKLRIDHMGRIPLWAIEIETDLIVGREELVVRLETLLLDNASDAS